MWTSGGSLVDGHKLGTWGMIDGLSSRIFMPRMPSFLERSLGGYDWLRSADRVRGTLNCFHICDMKRYEAMTSFSHKDEFAIEGHATIESASGLDVLTFDLESDREDR
jgi:hypothetical protein